MDNRMTGTAIIMLGGILVFVGLLLCCSPGPQAKPNEPKKEAKAEQPHVVVLCGNCEPPPQCYRCHNPGRWRG